MILVYKYRNKAAQWIEEPHINEVYERWELKWDMREYEFKCIKSE